MAKKSWQNWFTKTNIAVSLILVVALYFIGAYLFSINGSYPTLNQDVQNITTGNSEMVTWSIGPDSFGGLNGAGGEIDVFYNLASVQIDGQTLLTYTNNGQGNGYWQYVITPVNINGSYVTATVSTITSMPVGTYYHANGYYMCDAVHQNIAGQRYTYPKMPVYTFSVTGLPAGTHTITTGFATGAGITYDPTGYHICAGANANRVLTDTFIVTNPAAPPPSQPNVNVLSLASVTAYIKNLLCSWFGVLC